MSQHVLGIGVWAGKYYPIHGQGLNKQPLISRPWQLFDRHLVITLAKVVSYSIKQYVEHGMSYATEGTHDRPIITPSRGCHNISIAICNPSYPTHAHFDDNISHCFAQPRRTLL